MTQPPLASEGVTRRAYEAASRTIGVALRNMAVQDWVVALFHLVMWLRVSAAPDSAEGIFARRFALALLTVTACTIVLVRGGVLPQGRLRALVYRLGLFAPMVLSYFELRYLLPALQPKLLDHQLHAIDEVLFGVTPSVWMAQFNTAAVVEWFAFFYYGYFFILGSMLLPALFFDRGERLQQLMVGAMLVCCLGHFTYTLVPGLGPYATLEFDEPLRGGMFLHLVWKTVDQAGAMLDIFPSLHTAYPTFFALFAFGQRHRAPFKYLWPLVAFVAANMVIATMFLRWHWGIDVIAGLTLAFAAWRLAIVIARWEAERGVDGDRQPIWEPVVGRR